MIYGPLSEMLLDGRYRVGEVVGTGGFGTVYGAMHVGLAGKVAIKVPRVDDLAPGAIAGAIATFLEEGRMLKRLRHPALVAALDVALLAHRDIKPRNILVETSGARTDVFALALVLCETIRGAPVFADDEDARRAVVDGNIALVASGDPELSTSAHLKKILGTTTAARIAERPRAGAR